MKHTNKFGRLLACAAVVSMGLMAAQAWAKFGSAEEIAQRLAPAGELCEEGMDCGGTVVQASAGPKSPSDIYSSVCTACHDTGAAGAPKKGDKQAWASRISQGMDVLYDHSINGFKGMPAKGGNPKLSDDEVKAVVDFLVEASR